MANANAKASPKVNVITSTEKKRTRAASASTHQKRTPERIRLSLDVSPDLYELLETTASQIGASKSDVLRKAIVLMSVVADAQTEGKVFGVANNDREPISKQIVGLF
jgi:hypothetical protein